MSKQLSRASGVTGPQTIATQSMRYAADRHMICQARVRRLCGYRCVWQACFDVARWCRVLAPATTTLLQAYATCRDSVVNELPDIWFMVRESYSTRALYMSHAVALMRCIMLPHAAERC